MWRTLSPTARSIEFSRFIADKKMITIEPIMDFGLKEFVSLIYSCKPFQVNIGADSGKNNLSEPPKEKVLELISELEKFTKVHLKPNLQRVIK